MDCVEKLKCLLRGIYHEMFVFENGHPSLMESMERGHHPLEKYAILGALLFYLFKVSFGKFSTKFT